MQGNRFIRNGSHHKYSLHLEKNFLSVRKKKGGPAPVGPSLRPQAKKNKTILSGCKLIGWARPKNFLDIYHHPQPPSKYIGYSEIRQEVYLHLGKINLLQLTWDLVGCTYIPFVGIRIKKLKPA